MGDLHLNYDLSQGNMSNSLWERDREVHGLRYALGKAYPCEIKLNDWGTTSEEEVPEVAFYEQYPNNSEVAIWHFGATGVESLLVADLGHGEMTLRGAGRTYQLAQEALDKGLKWFPKAEVKEEHEVPIAFWSYGNHGPTRFNRRLDASKWNEVVSNYTRVTREGLETVMAGDWRPGRGGQTLIWHGEPGTGKTNALRALAQAWRPWARFHYITDPEKFFGSHADYMMGVLMGMEDEIDDVDEDGRFWRVLILEDTGELLQKDSKEKLGQGMSRFLNVADGLIGQGLRVMTLVTTNEELGALHDAVTRPGRAAHELHFGRLTTEECHAWFGAAGLDPVPEIPSGGMSLAELYALVENRQPDTPAGGRKLVGFA